MMTDVCTPSIQVKGVLKPTLPDVLVKTAPPPLRNLMLIPRRPRIPPTAKILDSTGMPANIDRFLSVKSAVVKTGKIVPPVFLIPIAFLRWPLL